MTTTTTDRPELLDGIMTVHEAMRRDVRRLPGAIERADEDGVWVLARWFVKFERETVHHHHREDDVVWPLLLERAPEFVESLDGLETDHFVLDRAMSSMRAALTALTGTTGEPDRSCAVRSALELRDILLDHLDREEAAVFPLIEATFTVDDMAAIERALLKATPLRVVAFEIPFAFDGLDRDEVNEALADLPLPLRALYRFVWEPAYRRLTAPLTLSGPAPTPALAA